ncbi:hypothetical protein N431DRAFT_485940 [Stipitochalara longipes BDJ]|nr:hypothetical protein N431DRAFT_485940 [Stipitochalara longipes BDJ]
MANTFGIALRAALSVLFRRQAPLCHQVEFVPGFRRSILAAAPTLCLLAAFIWALQVVTSLPPVAITIFTVQRASYEILVVPTLNASSMGNNSGADTYANSLSTLSPAPENGPPYNGLTTGVNYSIQNTWVNNVYSQQVTKVQVDKLINLEILNHGGGIIFPSITQNGTYNCGTAPANWTTATLAFYRDNNYIAMFDPLMSWLENGTIIDNTRFNSIPNTCNSSSHPQFQISEDVCNDYPLNMTVSAMQTYSRWNASVNATRGTAVNVYSFSAPLNLLVPYFVTSAILDRAAAGGCLGGDENFPRELKDLKIRFGEFISHDDAPVKRAGFGVENETTSLKNGANYEIGRWI